MSGAIERLLPNAVHFREFQNDPTTGHHYTGTCGETALATAMVCASEREESTQEAILLMMSMTREMMALGWADKPNGSTTTRHLFSYAERHGYAVDTGAFKDSRGVSHPKFIGYQEPLDMPWLHELLLATAGVQPVVLEVARAGNLDSLNGGHDERGVEYHFICVVGINAQGYVCNDGDNSEAASHLALYPWSELEQARPCGILILDMQGDDPVAALDIKQVAGYFEQSGDAWKCKKNGVLVRDSILDFYRGPSGGLSGLGLPLHERFYVGKVCVQVFERGVAVYDPERKYDNPPGAEGPVYLGHLDDLRVLGILTPDMQRALDDAKAALAAAQAQVKDLQAQVAALQNQEPEKADDPLGDALRALFAEAKKEGVL